jgi:hypothetical protein
MNSTNLEERSNRKADEVFEVPQTSAEPTEVRKVWKRDPPINNDNAATNSLHTF